MGGIGDSLQGIRVAVPESRQLDTLVQLLQRRGATVIKTPLVAIHDAPDEAPVLAWIRRFIDKPPEIFIILTGEGLRRLLGLAERYGIRKVFEAALSNTRLLCRGPKPERVLREIGLKTSDKALEPTTDGVIKTLETMEIEGQVVAVQLYGEDPNHKLMEYLVGRQVQVDSVAPYVYADDSDTSRVVSLIKSLSFKEVDVIAFTSKPQLRRLKQVAKKHDLEDQLKTGLGSCCIAAVGPVIKDQLEAEGYEVTIMPDRAFFMKPLVTEIMRYYNKE